MLKPVGYLQSARKFRNVRIRAFSMEYLSLHIVNMLRCMAIVRASLSGSGGCVSSGAEGHGRGVKISTLCNSYRHRELNAFELVSTKFYKNNSTF